MHLIPPIYAAGPADSVSISTLPTPVGLKIPNSFTLTDLLTKGGINLINLIFVIIGLFFFANLVLAGWDYMLASGDPKKIASATSRIINGLIGIVMALCAFLVVRIVTGILGFQGV